MPRRAIILGLGVAGPLSALALLQRTNLSITIYELRPAPATIGGALNLAPNAVRLLRRLGFDIDRLGAPVPTVLQQDSQGRQLAIHSYGGLNNTFAKPFTGRRVMRKDFLVAILAALKPYQEDGRVNIVFAKKAVDLVERADSATLYFEDGTSETADVILGADGIHSWTRTHMETELWKTSPQKCSKVTYTGLASLYAIVDASDLPKHAIDRIRAHAMITASSQSAGLVVACAASDPLKEVVWFVSRTPPTPPSPDAAAPDSDEIRADVIKTYGEYPSPFPELIAATRTFAYWPVYRLDPLPCAWASPKGRVVLVGDAAHAMEPHAAQGVGMSVEDSILIAKILTAVEDSGAWGDLSAGLWDREYRARRSPRCQKFAATATKRGHARKPQGWFASTVREWLAWLASPILRIVSRWRDIHGWGYDIDKENVRVP